MRGRRHGKTCPTWRFLSKCGLPGVREVAKRSGSREPKKYRQTRRGVLRYQCKTCGKTFTETTGTIFFWKHANSHEILEVQALLTESSRISTLRRVKGIKEDTVQCWLREAYPPCRRAEPNFDERIPSQTGPTGWPVVVHPKQRRKKAIWKPLRAALSGSRPGWIWIAACE